MGDCRHIKKDNEKRGTLPCIHRFIDENLVNVSNTTEQSDHLGVLLGLKKNIIGINRRAKGTRRHSVTQAQKKKC